MTDINFLIIVVTAISAVITEVYRRNQFAARIPTQLNTLSELAKVAVTAAEETSRKLQLDSKGKLDYATLVLTSFGQRVGVPLSPEEADALIHAALGGAREQEELVKQYIATAGA